MSLNEQLQEAHSQSFGTEKKILSNFSVDDASTADNKVIHATFENPEDSMEEQPELEDQQESKEMTTARIHDLIRAWGGDCHSFQELEKMLDLIWHRNREQLKSPSKRFSKLS